MELFKYWWFILWMTTIITAANCLITENNLPISPQTLCHIISWFKRSRILQFEIENYNEHVAFCQLKAGRWRFMLLLSRKSRVQDFYKDQYLLLKKLSELLFEDGILSPGSRCQWHALSASYVILSSSSMQMCLLFDARRNLLKVSHHHHHSALNKQHLFSTLIQVLNPPIGVHAFYARV